jgi:hypothetical protein
MSKDRQEQAGALLSAEEIARNQAAANRENETPPEIPPNPGGEKKEDEKKPATPSKLTADQYLKRAPQGAGIGELVRSLYRTKIMSFEEWESTVKALLKKQVR